MRRRRRLAAAILATALIPVGVADLASNEVPATQAGSMTTPVVLTPVLRAIDADAEHLLRAELGLGDQPLVGFPIDFVLPDGDVVCAGVETDSEGLARCDASSAHSSAGTWQARFTGAGALREAAGDAKMPAMTDTGTRPGSSDDSGVDPGPQ